MIRISFAPNSRRSPSVGGRPRMTIDGRQLVPSGAGTMSVHCTWPLTVVQPADDGEMFCVPMTDVPIATRSDCDDGETNCAERAADAGDDAGTAMVNAV